MKLWIRRSVVRIYPAVPIHAMRPRFQNLPAFVKMNRQRLLLSVALVLATCSVAAAGCLNLPTAWVDPGGRPVPVYVYERAVQTCRLAAENFSGADWRSHVVACTRKRGFKPVYHDVFC
jgi:hypothetical protein